MTPTELLAEAKSHFPILYVDDAAFLGALLKSSLGKYQDKAGVILSQSIPVEDISIDLPPGFAGMGIATDAKGNFHEHFIADGKVNIVERVFPNASIRPFSFTYFLDLRNYDLETDLPNETISLLLDHLESSIDIYNTARARRVAQSTGQEAVDFPSDQELRERRTAIEVSMEENMSIIPIASIHFYERGYN